MLSIPQTTTAERFEGCSLTPDDVLQITACKRLQGLAFINCPLTDDDVKTLSALPQLVNLTIEGSRITDMALKYLAQLPKLSYLFLDRNTFNGSGFAFFDGNKKIECLSVSNTHLDDQGLEHISKMKRLGTLHLDNTKVTLNGMMAVANNPRLSIVPCTRFPKDHIAAFEQRQRDLKKAKKSANPDDCAAAKHALQSFFDAYTTWGNEASARKDPFGSDTIAAYTTLIQTYCSEQKIKEGGPFSITAEAFSNCTLADEEQISANRLYLYFYDRLDRQRRVLMLRTETSWKVDSMQWHDAGWKKDYF